MHGSWSTRLQPYYPFWEYVGSSDFAYCPIDGVAQKWPEGGALTGQSADSASYCVVNGSIADEIYDYRLATHTIATLQLAKRVRPANFFFCYLCRKHSIVFRRAGLSSSWLGSGALTETFSSTSGTGTCIRLQLKLPLRSSPSDPRASPLSPFVSAAAPFPSSQERRPRSGCTDPAGFKLPNGTSYPGDPDNAWPVEIQQIARKAYYTAITQTDAQVGRVLDALDAIGHEKDTIVVVSAGECRHSSLYVSL